MRTTVTLDPDVEHYVREACHQQKASFKRVLNDALRKALKPPEARSPELMPPRPMGFAPGIDPKRLGDLADELESETFLAAETARRYGHKDEGR